jgi:hypothetical protein
MIACLKWLSSWFRSRPRGAPVFATIEADDERVVITRSDGTGPHSFAWRDVDEVQTFKLDLFGYDDIRLAFRVGDLWHEVGEEDAGFVELGTKMAAKLPSVPENWYMEVMFPAFATNLRTLWKRA